MSLTPTPTKRNRGRPRGTQRIPQRPRGLRSLSAAEVAAAAAAKKAAYAAYGYSYTGKH